MSRAPHRMLAALLRGGGAPARLMGSLATAGAWAAALDVDLDAHPLCRAGEWGALAPAPAPEGRLATLLARLAAARETTARSRPAGSAPLLAGATPALPPRGAVPKRQAAPRAVIEPPVTGRRATVGIARPAAEGAGRPRPTVASASADRGGRDPKAGPDVSMPPRPTLPVGSDPVLLAASRRPVARGAAPEIARAVADLLSTASDEPARSPAVSEATEGAAAARIAAILDRIASPPAAARREGRLAEPASVEAGQIPLRDTAGRESPFAHPARSGGARDAVAPRNGIERLLARGRQENLVPAGDPAVHAGPALGHHAGQGPGIALADLALSRRSRPAEQPQPPAVAVAQDPEAFARSLTDLLRREARSAGIDLKGGQ